MPKKKPSKQIFENAQIESAEANVEPTKPAKADPQEEAVLPDPNAQEETVEVPASEEQSSSEASETSASVKEETSAEDLLEDVRRSLIEDEETQKGEKKSKWWRRRGKDKKAKEEKPATPVEIDLPAVTAPTTLASEPMEEKASEDYEDQIDELIDMLETETEQKAPLPVVTGEVEAPAEPEPEIDIEAMKKQAFRPRAADEEPEDFTEVRSIALEGEGGEEVFVEVESKAPDQLEERLSAFENALRPYRRYINISLAFLGLAMAVVASLILFNIYQRSLSNQPVEEVSNLPYPTSVALPGGWSFTLGKGTLQAGEWKPKGAEWLQGTEVCRWVALPWSTQLEAVIRTLNPDDPIQLGMSNNDKLVYKVYSVRQLTPEEMQKLDSNSPCLLLVLVRQDSDKRWVLTALP